MTKVELVYAFLASAASLRDFVTLWESRRPRKAALMCCLLADSISLDGRHVLIAIEAGRFEDTGDRTITALVRWLNRFS